MTTQLEALNKHKANARHLKLFNQGIELFNQGVKCTIDDSAIKDGWKCGEQMRDIKIVTLSASRVKFNVD